jgi:hypothetical protein
MDHVYESASFTIVAAAGEDANAGLPGLRKGSRAPETATIVFSNGRVSALALSRPGLVELVERSRWNLRGWTYQEHVLSECCLFFTETEVFYSCPHHKDSEIRGTHLRDTVSEWREGYALENIFKDDDATTPYQTRIP